MRRVVMTWAVVIVGLAGCAGPVQRLQPRFPYAQTASSYLEKAQRDHLLISLSYQARLDSALKNRMLRPWTADTLSHTCFEAYWAARYITTHQGFGENMLPLPENWATTLIENADSSSYGLSPWKGMNTVRSSLRALPTVHPFYLDFNRAGEGFPFDYLQNSALPVNTPLCVLNQSRDKAWLLVDSHHAMGWVPARQVVRIDSVVETTWRQSLQVAPVSEPVTLTDSLGRFLAQARIGSSFPLIDATEAAWRVAIVVDDGTGYGRIETGMLTREAAVRRPWALTQSHLLHLTRALMYQPYGWGGLFENRDCSAMLKDYFFPFGIWLPRNSGAQAGATPYRLELQAFGNKEKEARIIAQGLPLLSLLWKPGHIMLYTGASEGRPMIFHNLWGLKTKPLWGKTGRHIIGQAVITSLTPGRDLGVKHRKGSLLEGVARMTTVVHPDSILSF